jgi:hypothetical protein
MSDNEQVEECKALATTALGERIIQGTSQTNNEWML